MSGQRERDMGVWQYFQGPLGWGMRQQDGENVIVTFYGIIIGNTLKRSLYIAVLLRFSLRSR